MDQQPQYAAIEKLDKKLDGLMEKLSQLSSEVTRAITQMEERERNRAASCPFRDRIAVAANRTDTIRDLDSRVDRLENDIVRISHSVKSVSSVLGSSLGFVSGILSKIVMDILGSKFP